MMHAEHVHQKAQKSQRAPIGLDHHCLGQSPPPTDIFLATALKQFSRKCGGKSDRTAHVMQNVGLIYYTVVRMQVLFSTQGRLHPFRYQTLHAYSVALL